MSERTVHRTGLSSVTILIALGIQKYDRGLEAVYRLLVGADRKIEWHTVERPLKGYDRCTGRMPLQRACVVIPLWGKECEPSSSLRRGFFGSEGTSRPRSRTDRVAGNPRFGSGRRGAVGWRSHCQHPSSSFPNSSGGSAASRGGRFIPAGVGAHALRSCT